MSSSFKLADHVVCRKTNSNLRMLFDRDKGVMYELNETATAIVEYLERDGPVDPGVLSQQLAGEFDAPAEEIHADVSAMLSDLADAGIVVAV